MRIACGYKTGFETVLEKGNKRNNGEANSCKYHTHTNTHPGLFWEFFGGQKYETMQVERNNNYASHFFTC